MMMPLKTCLCSFLVVYLPGRLNTRDRNETVAVDTVHADGAEGSLIPALTDVSRINEDSEADEDEDAGVQNFDHLLADFRANGSFVVTKTPKKGANKKNGSPSSSLKEEGMDNVIKSVSKKMKEKQKTSPSAEKPTMQHPFSDVKKPVKTSSN